MIGKRLLGLVASVGVATGVAPSVWGQVDYRPQQSEVKDQGMRGTCAAFSVCAAMETFPGVPTDLSEQILYASIKLHQNSTDLWRRALGIDPTMVEGDRLGTYAEFARALGTCPEAVFPYNPNPKAVPETVPEEVRRYIELAQVTPEDLERLRRAVGVFRAVVPDDGLLQLDGAKDVERIKAELDAGRLAIPVSYVIHTAGWPNLDETGNIDASGVRDIVHPGMLEQFGQPGGAWMTYNEAKAACMASGTDLLEGLESGAWVRRPHSADEAYGGHAVTIVGYDDIGFIIKNSWGTQWGTGGYCRVAFDYHRLYAMEALLIDAVTVHQWPSSSLKRRPEIENARWRVKLMPSRDDAGLTLSTWALAPRQPDVQIVEYSVYAYAGDAEWSLVTRSRVLITERAEQRAAQLPLSPEQAKALADAGTALIKARYGYFTLDDPTRMEDAVFPAERQYGPFTIDLSRALDLPPTTGG